MGCVWSSVWLAKEVWNAGALEKTDWGSAILQRVFRPSPGRQGTDMSFIGIMMPSASSCHSFDSCDKKKLQTAYDLGSHDEEVSVMSQISARTIRKKSKSREKDGILVKLKSFFRVPSLLL